MSYGTSSSAKPPAQKVQITLTNELISRLKPSKVFHDAVERPNDIQTNHDPSQPSSSTSLTHLPQITSLSFDDSGEKLLTTGEDEGFALWDIRKGKKVKNFWSKKYGVGLGRFTHRSSNIIHASTKIVQDGSGPENSHALRYHSMHDNKYISYFRGHTAKVRSVCMNPVDDTFISGGDDGTIRLWDLRLPECKGVLNGMGGSVIATFDNTGSVFAVACSATQTIAMYACASMDTAPFVYKQLYDPTLEEISQPPPLINVTSLSISNNGLYLLIGTDSDVHYLYDAFELDPIRRLTGHRPLGKNSGEECSFSADSRFVISGSAEGGVYFWRLPLMEEEGKWESIKPDPRGRKMVIPTLQAQIAIHSSDPSVRWTSRAVKFNPRFGVMAVGGEELSFWLPAQDEEAKIEAGW